MVGSAVALVIAFLFILLLDHFLYFAIIIPIQIEIICHSIIKFVQKVISRSKKHTANNRESSCLDTKELLSSAVFFCFRLFFKNQFNFQIPFLFKSRRKQFLFVALYSRAKISNVKIFLFCLDMIKFIYPEKATKFFKISTLLYAVLVKSKVKILKNLVALSENINELQQKRPFII